MHTFLVFGLTGDLMKKKGIPALFALWEEKKLPENFRVVGLSRKVWGTEALEAHLTDAVGKPTPKEFASLFSIYTGAGENAADVVALKKEFALESDTLFTYLCVSPELYTEILKSLKAAELFANTKALLIEKPFGSDLTSALALQALITANIPEEKVYRIDHFLAKEAMQDLSSLSNKEVASIGVYLNEALGVEKRGAMYDPVGAFRDVAQNHLLESAAAIFGDRALALEQLHILSSEEIARLTTRSQHEGYREIEGVKPGSDTETYFKVESWFEQGGRQIPLILESGKRLPTRREVVVTFTDGSETIIPFESGTNEYQTLFAEAFMGNRNRFVSMHEVEALWRFTDPIENEWHQNSVPLASYKPYPLG